ncbi:MAG: YqeG family HAD IIIA-type phosphatase [Clostridia bacterium]|nr:YqeG family HAD IIIA-type phosphatase [Clostridia bacterium]
MKHLLMPHYMFKTYDEITPEFLTSLGVKAVLSDVDNTLAPYEQPEPDERLHGWVEGLAKAGISIAFISNNDGERIELFNRTLGVPAYWKSGKPFKKSLLHAMKDLGTDQSNTVMLGDQLLTDAWAGNAAGLKVIIVPPIRDKRNLFFRFKRWLEIPTVKRFKKKHGIDW